MIILGYLLQFASRPLILDVGCGQGRLLELIHLIPYRGYLGIDIAPQAIRQAKKMADDRDQLEVADYTAWCPNQLYDTIIFNETIYYACDPIGVLKGYCRFLLPKGVLLVSVHHYLSQARIRENIETESIMLARDRVENRLGQVWEVWALQPQKAFRARLGRRLSVWLQKKRKTWRLLITPKRVR
jgi:SAM-dependent methyltransferase